MPTKPSERQLDEFFTRAVADVIVRDDLARLLRSGERRLRIKQGFDPTRPNLHIGHAISLRKLRTFAQWGHDVVIIVGDLTTQIGDPTDKDETRPMITHDEVMANAKTYLDQFHLIVPRENVRIVLQSEWFGKFGLRDVIELASRFTVQQLLAREEFRNRQAAGTPIPVKDILYPLLQAYDSVAIEADVEVGGTDQLFNLLGGRQLQEQVGQRPQNVFITHLLEGLDGEKMSKSKPRTGIWLTDKPNDMFGKVMAIHDDLMPHWFEWATEMPMSELHAILDALRSGELRPRDAKERLARRIVSELVSEDAAETAADAFAKQFRDRAGATETTSRPVSLDGTDVPIADLLVALGLVRSKSEARNLVAAGSVKIDGRAADRGARVARGARPVIELGRHRVQPDWE